MHILADIGVDNVILVGKYVPVRSPITLIADDALPRLETRRPMTLRDAYDFPEIVDAFQRLEVKLPDGRATYGLLIMGQRPELLIYGEKPQPAKMETGGHDG
jgi:hypothetical protein